MFPEFPIIIIYLIIIGDFSGARTKYQQVLEFVRREVSRTKHLNNAKLLLYDIAEFRARMIERQLQSIAEKGSPERALQGCHGNLQQFCGFMTHKNVELGLCAPRRRSPVAKMCNASCTYFLCRGFSSKSKQSSALRPMKSRNYDFSYCLGFSPMFTWKCSRQKCQRATDTGAAANVIFMPSDVTFM